MNSGDTKTPALSVAIVCKDNESTIARTLDSIKPLASEIVAVDSGSTDGTIPLLEAAGARIIHSPWLGHIRTKQLALDSCTRDWILSIDSDEAVEPALATSIQQTLARNPRESAFALNRKTYYKDRPLNHAWQPEWRVRLVRKGHAAWGGLDPHDKLEVTKGTIGKLSGHLRHDSFPSFAEHLRKQYHHASTMAKSLHASGKRGSYASLLVSPPGAFLKQLILKRALLDGYPGWLAAASTASAALIKHAVLIELSRSNSDSA